MITIMIIIFMLLFISMLFISRMKKKRLKIILGTIVTLFTIYCVILSVDMNRVFSLRKPIFAKENGHMGSMIRYDGLLYKVGIETHDNKIYAAEMWIGNVLIAAAIT